MTENVLCWLPKSQGLHFHRTSLKQAVCMGFCNKGLSAVSLAEAISQFPGLSRAEVLCWWIRACYDIAILVK